jgi:hypothetical protein
MWKPINQLVNKNSRSTNISVLQIDEQVVTENETIGDLFNEYFTDIGPNLSNQITETNADFKCYMKFKTQHKFNFKNINIHEVLNALEKLQRRLSQLDMIISQPNFWRCEWCRGAFFSIHFNFHSNMEFSLSLQFINLATNDFSHILPSCLLFIAESRQYISSFVTFSSNSSSHTRSSSDNLLHVNHCRTSLFGTLFSTELSFSGIISLPPFVIVHPFPPLKTD